MPKLLTSRPHSIDRPNLSSQDHLRYYPTPRRRLPPADLPLCSRSVTLIRNAQTNLVAAVDPNDALVNACGREKAKRSSVRKRHALCRLSEGCLASRQSK
eukprot:5661268-Alexandrium_andersonii.AAC.1